MEEFKVKILLDAMGGDNAPDANIKGALNAINKRIYRERNRRSF